MKTPLQERVFLMRCTILRVESKKYYQNTEKSFIRMITYLSLDDMFIMSQGQSFDVLLTKGSIRSERVKTE